MRRQSAGSRPRGASSLVQCGVRKDIRDRRDHSMLVMASRMREYELRAAVRRAAPQMGDGCSSELWDLPGVTVSAGGSYRQHRPVK